MHNTVALCSLSKLAWAAPKPLQYKPTSPQKWLHYLLAKAIWPTLGYRHLKSNASKVTKTLNQKEVLGGGECGEGREMEANKNTSF